MGTSTLPLGPPGCLWAPDHAGKRPRLPACGPRSVDSHRTGSGARAPRQGLLGVGWWEEPIGSRPSIRAVGGTRVLRSRSGPKGEQASPPAGVPPALPCRAALPSPRGAPPGLPLRRRTGPWAKPTFCCERRAALPTRFLRAPSRGASLSAPQPPGESAHGAPGPPWSRARGPRGRAQGTASSPPGSRTDAAWRCLRCPGHRLRGDGREGTRVVGMSGGSRLYGKPAVGCSSQNRPTPLTNTSRGKRGRDGKSILSGALFLP